MLKSIVCLPESYKEYSLPNAPKKKPCIDLLCFAIQCETIAIKIENKILFPFKDQDQPYPQSNNPNHQTWAPAT